MSRLRPLNDQQNSAFLRIIEHKTLTLPLNTINHILYNITEWEINSVNDLYTCMVKFGNGLFNKLRFELENLLEKPPWLWDIAVLGNHRDLSNILSTQTGPQIYQYVWLNCTTLNVHERSNTYFNSEQQCRAEAVKNDVHRHTNHLLIESICPCLINKTHNDKMACECYKDCTVDGFAQMIIDGVCIRRAPWNMSCTKNTNKVYYFNVNFSDVWFESEEYDIADAYKLHLLSM